MSEIVRSIRHAGRGLVALVLILGMVIIALSTALGARPAAAVAPDEILADARLEARARALSRNLRCVVCQNQSIDDSDAPLAKDLRMLVRERLTQGDSDAQATAFIVDRYGTFVLLQPPVQTNTLVLWLAPLLMLGAAIWGFRRHLAARTPAAGGRGAGEGEPDALSPDEARRLRALLEADAQTRSP